MSARNLVRAAIVTGLLLVVALSPQWAMTPPWVAGMLGVQLAGAGATTPRRTVDGDTRDWQQTLPPIGNTAALISNGSETEWVWRDKIGDQRTDFDTAEHSYNWDIKQVRIIADDTCLYILCEVRNMDAGYQNAFQLDLAIDTQIAFGATRTTTGFNWFGDQSGTNLGRPEQYSDANISLDNNSPNVWMYYDQSYVQGWKGLTWANWNRAWINDGTGQYGSLMEASIKWSELGLSSIPPLLRLSIASARTPWTKVDPNAIDNTTDLFGSDFLDVIGPDRSNATDEWNDELSDGVVSSYVDIAFDASGNCIDTLPAAPANIKAWDPTVETWLATGETCVSNNPIIQWDAVAPDGDAQDTITGYYVQIATKDSTGYLHAIADTVVTVNSGAYPLNQVTWINTTCSGVTTVHPWLGGMDSEAWLNGRKGDTGVPNSDAYGHAIFTYGQTYFIKVWARDRRGMLGAASSTFMLPIDYPVWHDPYVFTATGTTFRGNRDPKENADVNFLLNAFDTAPTDPGDSSFYNPWTLPAVSQKASRKILNVILHIRLAKIGSASYDWATQAGNVIMGAPWYDNNGNIGWYYPNQSGSISGMLYKQDSYSFWTTGGFDDVTKTWLYKFTRVNLGNSGGSNTFKLQSAAGDTIEYYFEINNASEAPAGSYLPSNAPRRYVYAYDTEGITGYRMGTLAQAQANPFRFIVQKRDLIATWHNPLSKEVPFDSWYMMRNPPWPETSPQIVRMYVGAVGWSGWSFQMVWRSVDSGGWNVSNFTGPTVLADTARSLYYYRHDFTYPGGMIEYYFKLSDNSAYIFANGVTDNVDTVYYSSIGSSGEETVPFRFPFTSRVKVTSTASVGSDSHSMVAVLHFRSPRIEALDENAIGVNGILNLDACTATITGNVFTNAFPAVQVGKTDSSLAIEPRNILGRSYMALLSGYTNAVNGLRKAFFGPIFPIDYNVTDSTAWNTGADAYENVPILTYSAVFEDAVEKKKASGTVFGGAEPLEGVIYVPGPSQITTMSITKGSLIADSITIPSTATVTATRLDLIALNGPIYVNGSLTIDTGIVFSNDTIYITPGATVKLKRLGSITSQGLRVDTGAVLSCSHPTTASFLTAKESVFSRATRWVIATIRESR